MAHPTRIFKTPEELEKAWFPIEGFTGYEVNRQGEVRSFRKTGCDGLHEYPTTLKPHKVKTHCKEYIRYRITDDNRKPNNVYAHRIVALTFIENKENKPQVHHIDNDGLNNRVDNLEWVTNSENQIERTDWKRPSGHKYVHKSRGTWRVYNRRLGIDKSFKELTEAVEYAKKYY